MATRAKRNKNNVFRPLEIETVRERVSEWGNLLPNNFLKNNVYVKRTDFFILSRMQGKMIFVCSIAQQEGLQFI